VVDYLEAVVVQLAEAEELVRVPGRCLLWAPKDGMWEF